ncbi:hypothetical protein H6758_00975 [Candidatus Nomurabacteria bacterium]|nr:hypothetical protein [Candidatus Nomurabacteria bacterium]
MRYVHKILFVFAIIIFLGMISFPLVQMVWQPFHPRPLDGFELSATMPKVTKAAWMTGEYQKQTLEYVSQNIGFRGYMVRTDNELTLRVFDELPSGTVPEIVMGKDEYLFERAYIDAMYNKPWTPSSILDKKARDLSRFEQKLAARGVPFVLLIAPSKASVYPEWIPDKYVRRDLLGKTDYERILPYLDKYGVSYFDANAFLVERKSQSDFLSFGKPGTHWSYYGGCLVTSAFMQYLDQQSGEDYLDLSCDPVKHRNYGEGSDIDLLRTLNIWSEERFMKDIVTPTIRWSQQGKMLEEVLWVGDSFSWVLFDMFEKGPVYKKRDMYYYYSTHYGYPEGTQVRIDRSSLDWNQVSEYDLVVIEATQTAMGQIGFGAVEDALEFLP